MHLEGISMCTENLNRRLPQRRFTLIPLHWPVHFPLLRSFSFINDSFLSKKLSPRTLVLLCDNETHFGQQGNNNVSRPKAFPATNFILPEAVVHFIQWKLRIPTFMYTPNNLHHGTAEVYLKSCWSLRYPHSPSSVGPKGLRLCLQEFATIL
jgi:hypothetical protein